MAVNDTVNIIPTSVANNASLTIQPGAGVEWLIKNLFYGAACEIYLSDGTNTIKIDSDGSAGGRFGLSILLTNAVYLTIKNVSGGAAYFSYNGVVTK